MWIRKIDLLYFRNYENQSLEFSSGINCIVGLNGSGKTNILESIFYLGLGKGFFSKNDKICLKKDEDYFNIKAEIEQDSGKINDFLVAYHIKKKKQISKDKIKFDKLSQFIGTIPIIAVLPKDTNIISESSAERRALFDFLISQYKRTYVENLLEYNKIIKNRNKQLRIFREKSFFDHTLMEIYDEKLIPLGQAIFSERKAFLEEFTEFFEKRYLEISDSREMPALGYSSKIENNTAEEWQTKLSENLEKDRILQYSSFGVHRDDWIFKMDEEKLRHFASQGQQKTFILSVKLAQYDFLKHKSNKQPILLLDDIFDKLDEERIENLLHILHHETIGQVFITDTSHHKLQNILSKNDISGRFFFVENGTAKVQS